MLVIKKLSKEDKTIMVRLAQKYTPATRALLGALLETLGEKSLTLTLFNSLNPISIYKLSGVKKVLPTGVKWNIR